MNIRQIKTLFGINLRYVNPQITGQRRKAGKTGNKLTNSLLIQYSLSGIVFLFIFTLMMLAIDFPKYPGYFGLYCLMYFIFAASQAFASLHNVMYESKDLKDLLPLPITNSSIFFAKFLSVAFTVLPYALPLLALFLMTGLRATGIIGIILAILAFLVVASLLLDICVWLISLLVQTKIFQRYKKTANAILLILPTVGSLGSYFYLLYQNNSKIDTMLSGRMVDRPVLPFFTPIFEALVHPISLGSLLFWGVSLSVLVLLLLVILKQTIPRMFELQLTESPVKENKNKVKKRTSKGTVSLSSLLFRYNLGLIKNPTLWLQVLSNGYIMPFALVFGGSMNGSIDLSQAPLKLFASFFLAGGFFAFLTTNPSSFCSLLISLDRENFPYIRSLPMNLATYLKAKFHFAYGLQLLLNTLSLVILSFIMHIPVLMTIALLVGNLIVQYVYAEFYYYRDFRLLNSTWVNISQLYTRGGGNWLTVGLLFGNLIGGIVVVVLSVLILTFLPLPLLSNIILIAVMLTAVLLVHLHYQKVFWRKARLH